MDYFFPSSYYLKELKAREGDSEAEKIYARVYTHDKPKGRPYVK